jgi:hypothetical protein
VLQSDSCRLLQLQCHTAKPNHPFRSFSWGEFSLEFYVHPLDMVKRVVGCGICRPVCFEAQLCLALGF